MLGIIIAAVDAPIAVENEASVPGVCQTMRV